MNGAMTNVELTATGMIVDPLALLGGVPVLYEDRGTRVDVELGPGLTLTGMAVRTLKAKHEASDNSVGHTHVYC